MARDRLFLLPPKFTDDALPGRQFYCGECMAVYGLLNAYPEQAARLDLIQVQYPRPRREVVDAVGEANQALPLMVWDGGFTNDLSEIFDALHHRHGFPEVHP